MPVLSETEFDVIVYGTGLLECVVAGALARVGKKVLHLDGYDNYGGNMPGLTLLQFDAWFNQHQQQQQQQHSPSQQSLHSPGLTPEATSIRPIEKRFGFKKLASSAAAISDELKNEQRRYQLDVVPKFLMSNGPFVKLLIDSSISRYMQFKCPQVSMLFIDDTHNTTQNENTTGGSGSGGGGGGGGGGTFHKVPCSKGDVFQDRLISLVEKRFLMKFLHFCMDYDNSDADSATYQEFQDRPFADFLQHFKLSPKLQDFVFYSIALLHKADQISTKEALERMRLNLTSIGKYGNTPFLWPLFGVSEISQAFCRVGAVYGATYILRLEIPSLVINSQTNECAGVIVAPSSLAAGNDEQIPQQQQYLSCKHVVFAGDAVAADDQLVVQSLVHRYLCITDSSIFPDPAQQIAFAAIPPKNNNPEDNSMVPHNGTVFLIQLDHTCSVAPKGRYVVHFSTEVLLGQVADAESENVLDKCVNHLLNFGNPDENQQTRRKPRVLYYCSYVQYIRRRETSSAGAQPIPPNVHFCSDPDSELHIDRVVEQGKAIFRKICPDENEAPFFPRLPNPEDSICVEGEAPLDQTDDPQTTELPEPTTAESVPSQVGEFN